MGRLEAKVRQLSVPSLTTEDRDETDEISARQPSDREACPRPERLGISWYEVQADGTRKRRCLILGSLEQYPNETAAQKAVAALRADINAENPRTSLTPINVQTLIEHYREKELGPNCNKTRKTQVTYEGYFNKWILPRWGSYRVTDVKAVAVEQWLRSLQYANGIKAKARNIMSAVFNHAVRWEWLDANPIRMVRQSAKRTRIPLCFQSSRSRHFSAS